MHYNPHSSVVAMEASRLSGGCLVAMHYCFTYSQHIRLNVANNSKTMQEQVFSRLDNFLAPNRQRCN